jgi:uncharacterized protein (TIGR04255 family)
MSRLKDLIARPRSIYRRNPLAEVVAAVKFPRQLVLDQQLPVQFQEAIKAEFPLLRLKNAILYSMVAVGDDPPVTKQAPFASKIYEFPSEDQKQVVALLPDTLALTTTAYTRWEEFRPRFVRALEALNNIYRLPLYTRIGLRYKDLIDRTSLGIAHVPWERLINPDLLRSFTFFATNMEDHPSFTASVELALDGAQMRVNYGFVEDERKQVGFLIDTDCYVEPAKIREPAEITSALEELHKHTSLAFSACISDELHGALQPEPA